MNINTDQTHKTQAENDAQASELASMRATLAQFIQLIKQMDERIKTVEQKLVDLPVLSEHEKTITRFTASSTINRAINATPQAIAYAGHLYHVLNVPALRIYKYGILPQSKMHGLTTWDKQHLLDYCYVNDVMDIYEKGLPLNDVVKLTDMAQELFTYLDTRTEYTPKQPKLTKLEQAFARANEQQAKPLDFNFMPSV